MKISAALFFFLLTTILGFSQSDESPCSHRSIMFRHHEQNPNATDEFEQKEREWQDARERMLADRSAGQSTYVIPVVMHVFHNGDDGMMGMEQALSGLEILNQDFNGLNDGWDTIDPEFDPIKGSLDITFCLATIDPDGNPTTGIVYHEDEQMMLNQGDLFQFAWDNYKYLNIYFPKYTGGEWSLFTAYAYYPSNFNTANNIDGIFYSSIRWGYGNHSELEEGADWASVCSHEAGHWLDLRHTFENGCSGSGDLIDDTPPCTGGEIYLENCDNNDFTCGVHVNGENFMDYNHDCKKMFTLGQVERMTTALYLPSRSNLWTEANLVETGCAEGPVGMMDSSQSFVQRVYPNPASHEVNFDLSVQEAQLEIFDIQGTLIHETVLDGFTSRIDVSEIGEGVYFYLLKSYLGVERGQFVVSKQ